MTSTTTSQPPAVSTPADGAAPVMITPEPAPVTEPAPRHVRLGRFVADDSIPYALGAAAFYGSFHHLVALAQSSGQPHTSAVISALCIDVTVAMAARERKRDENLSRPRKGACSWPTVLLGAGVIATLAGNLATAQHSAWGWIMGAMPALALLGAISLIERRAAHADRMKAAAIETARLAEIARQREIAAARAVHDTLSQPSATRRTVAAPVNRVVPASTGQSVNAAPSTKAIAPPAPPVNPAPPASTTPPSTTADAPTATQLMRAHWDEQIAAGNVPTGADLNAAAGKPASSSLGRMRVAKWREEANAQALAIIAGEQASA